MTRRLLRVGFPALCLLSLAGCLATAALWVRSRLPAGTAVSGHRRYAAGEWLVGVRGGEAFLRIEPYPKAFVILTAVNGVRVPASEPVPLMSNWGFLARTDGGKPFPGVSWSEEYFSIPMTSGPPSRQVVSREWAVGLWLPCLLFGAAPALCLVRTVRSRRFGAGCCRACGYDLAGNVSGRCPECGTATTSPSRRGSAP